LYTAAKIKIVVLQKVLQSVLQYFFHQVLLLLLQYFLPVLLTTLIGSMYSRSRGVAVWSGVWLKAKETEISPVAIWGPITLV